MTDLLSHPLILKYFGCRAVCTEAHFVNMGYDEHERCMSYRILTAMQESIKDGEKFLLCYFDEKGEKEIYIDEQEAPADISRGDFKARFIIRLPSRFQPPPEAEEKKCCEWQKYLKMKADGSIAKLCQYHFDYLSGLDPKPPAPPAKEAEKCFCGGSDQEGHIPTEGHTTHHPTPDQAVEEKVRFLEGHFAGQDRFWILKQLFELVNLARRKA